MTAYNFSLTFGGASISNKSLAVVTPCDTFSGTLDIAEGFVATFDNGEAQATFDAYATAAVTYYIASAYHATLVLTYSNLVIHRKLHVLISNRGLT